MIGSLGKRYARALLEIIRPEGGLEAAGAELSRAVATFAEPRLRAVVLNPGIDAGARRHIVKEVVGSLGLSQAVGDLVRLLAERDRLPILPDVQRAYDAMVDHELGRSRVRIRSAAALGSAERAELTELARQLVGGGQVLITTEVDPELLGGVVLDVGGTVYDGSIRTQLARMGNEMAGGGA